MNGQSKLPNLIAGLLFQSVWGQTMHSANPQQDALKIKQFAENVLKLDCPMILNPDGSYTVLPLGIEPLTLVKPGVNNA